MLRGAVAAGLAAGLLSPVCGAAAPREPLAQEPYVGVACPVANSIACDRVGVAVWLRRQASSVTAAVEGKAVPLQRAWEDERGWAWIGYLQPAGLLGGALGVTPDRGRSHWEGRHPRDVRLRVRVRRGDVRTETSVVVALRAGWG